MRWAAVVIALALAGCGSTQVQGFVRDATTHEPLYGAHLAIDDETATTDFQGRYALGIDDSDAPRRVHVQRHGYRSQSLLVPFDPDLDHVYRDLELQPRETRP